MTRLKVAYWVYSVVGSALLGAWVSRQFGILHDALSAEQDVLDEVLQRVHLLEDTHATDVAALQEDVRNISAVVLLQGGPQ